MLSIKRFTIIIIVFSFFLTAFFSKPPVDVRGLSVIYKSGNITSNETWSTGNIYVVSDHVTVNAGVTLTIQEGVIIKIFDNTLIGVNGTLLVQGVSTNPVIFTSFKDDVGGDTNGDGSASAPQPGDWGHIAFLDSSVDAQNLMEYAVIRYGGYYHCQMGGYYDHCKYSIETKDYGALRFDGASPTINNSTIKRNLGYALSADINSYPIVGANTISENSGNGLEIRGGIFSTDLPATKYWKNKSVAYAITDHVTIPSGVALVIDPGVVVKFAENKLMGVNGVLKATGTLTSKITFTSLKDDTVKGDTNGDGSSSAPQAGDWGHIAFFDSSVDAQNIMEYTIVRYGGYYHCQMGGYYDHCKYSIETKDFGALRFDGASPTIKNSTIKRNLGYAISADINSYPVIGTNTISENGGNGLEIRGGTFSTDFPATKYWKNKTIAYAITDNVTIPSGVTLVIDPGVVVKFAENKLMGVSGVLKAVGTSTSKVTFTSIKDDTLKGDTNGDGSSSAPRSGDWGHIAFFDSSVDAQNLVKYAVVRYGGYHDCDKDDYYSGCSYEMYGALRFDVASPTISYNKIYKNSDGLQTFNKSRPKVLNNSIYANTGFAFINFDTSITVKAEYNWWGSDTGPYNPTKNPTGKGNKVSNYVDFLPFLKLPKLAEIE